MSDSTASIHIVYIAHHRPGNWDEGSAISWAFEQLGHKVTRVPEEPHPRTRRMRRRDRYIIGKSDLLLFHHTDNFDLIKSIDSAVKVFWHFDLVDYPDPTLASRCEARRKWMAKASALSDHGFCNDGDWVERDKTGKLSVLKEGADSRYCGLGIAKPAPPLLFVGSIGGGRQRIECISALRSRYGDDFHIVGNSGKTMVWARDLADTIASSQIVVCPAGPVTDLYWSNRACVSAGMGGFVIHPWSAGLAKHFEEGKEIIFYRGLDDLFAKIDHWMTDPDGRRKIGGAALDRVMREHTFLHRCWQLLYRLGIKSPKTPDDILRPTVAIP